MKEIKFNLGHDICHCTGLNCPIKEQCNRYLANLDSIQKKLKYVTYFVDPPYNKEENKCDELWKIN